MVYQQAVLTEVQARATRLGDSAALYRALGGGWWNRKTGQGAPAMSAKRILWLQERRYIVSIARDAAAPAAAPAARTAAASVRDAV
jgi:hypothetical protein